MTPPSPAADARSEKRMRIVEYLRVAPNSTANEIGRSLGYIDGRDVATQLKHMERAGEVVSTVAKRQRTTGFPIGTRYRLTNA